MIFCYDSPSRLIRGLSHSTSDPYISQFFYTLISPKILYNLCSYCVLYLFFVLTRVNSISTRPGIFFVIVITPYILWRSLDTFLLSERKESSDWHVWPRVNFCFNLVVIISDIVLKKKINVKGKKYTSSQSYILIFSKP